VNKKASFNSLILTSNKVVMPADYVASQEDLASNIWYSLVKDADNSSCSISVGYYHKRIGPPTTYFVRIAMYRLPLEGVESVSTKCPTCKKPTENEYVTVTPMKDDYEPGNNEDALNLLKLTKRLVLCTECGTLRLIN
jgi:hypothetical protein